MKNLLLVLTVAMLVALLATPAFPVAKEIVQLQAAVARLEADLRDMRSTLDERMGMMRQLMQQSTETVTKLNVAIEGVQRSIQGTVTAQSAKVDSVATNVQGLHDSLEDIRVRLGKLSEQMAQMRGAMETMQAPPQPAPTTGSAAPGGPPPAPEALYQNALRDLTNGNLPMAMQQFQDYLRFYPETELAGNAQYYMGEVYFRQGKYQEAIQAYDQVLERYPRGNKTAAAHLKKGFALMELKDREAGLRELRELLRRFPYSDEAKLARERYPSLGPPTGRAPVRRNR